jgi:hypothetical protein
MNQSPSEARSHSASQEIPCLLWNPEVHCNVHKSSAWSLSRTQMNPVHNLPPYFFNIHFNIITSFISRSSKRSLPFRFSDQNFVQIYHLSLHATYNIIHFQESLPIAERTYNMPHFQNLAHKYNEYDAHSPDINTRTISNWINNFLQPSSFVMCSTFCSSF